MDNNKQIALQGVISEHHKNLIKKHETLEPGKVYLVFHENPIVQAPDHHYIFNGIGRYQEKNHNYIEWLLVNKSYRETPYTKGIIPRMTSGMMAVRSFVEIKPEELPMFMDMFIATPALENFFKRT